MKTTATNSNWERIERLAACLKTLKANLSILSQLHRRGEEMRGLKRNLHFQFFPSCIFFTPLYDTVISFHLYNTIHIIIVYCNVM
ncbi:MAG: hypothetical protein RMI04_08850 [Thermofilaceae archaeon]|nr:hypothetical protein [Thermofilaceae archaeon]